MYTIPIPETKITQKSRERLGEAVYLLAYLIHRAQWASGVIRTSCRRIARHTGFPEATVRRWLGVLRSAGEVSTRRVADGVIITIQDYASIARTRKVPAPARSGAAAPAPPAADRSTTRSQSDRARTAQGSTAGDSSITCNTKPSQNKENYFSKESDYLDDEQLTQTADIAYKRSRPDPDALFKNQDQAALRLYESAKAVLSLDLPRRRELAREAAESMAADPRPFVRLFVVGDAKGEPGPRSAEGERQVLMRMGDLLQGRDPARSLQ